MVSAKFHIMGEDSQWLRIRLQEEILAHGLEGNVLAPGEKTLVVVAEGEKSVIKRLYSDVVEFLPEGVECGELAFSLQKPIRGLRIRHPEEHVDSTTLDYILQYLKEIEKTTQRLDQKLNTVIAMLEGTAGAVVWRKSEPTGTFEGKDMEVREDATSGFASMFGD